MFIEIHLSFKKSYKKRIANNAKLAIQTAQRIELFRQNPKHSLLKDHALIGRQKNLRAFSVSGDVRIVYMLLSEDRVLFLDVGTHNQVY